MVLKLVTKLLESDRFAKTSIYCFSFLKSQKHLRLLKTISISTFVIFYPLQLEDQKRFLLQKMQINYVIDYIEESQKQNWKETERFHNEMVAISDELV